MTISYSGNFTRILFRWKGSLWRSVWQPLLGYITAYYVLNAVICFALTPEQLEKFKIIRTYCLKSQERIPLLFLLGFYVSMVVSRWWVQFNCISWPDRFMITVISAIDGTTEEDRLVRRTYARWSTLMAALCWRGMASGIQKRFPTLEHLVTAGLMTKDELKIYEDTPCEYGKWWLPALWAASLARKLQDEGKLHVTQAKVLAKEINHYRTGFGSLACYDWVPVPLVYTQVAIVATYGYLTFMLISQQLIPGDTDAFNPGYVPILAILQFIFIQGWISVGENFMSPFGEDDDDFEMNWILDRNFFIAMLLADSSQAGLPAIEKDRYWGVTSPHLNHTRISSDLAMNVFGGHLTDLKLSPEDMEVVVSDDEDDEVGKKFKENIVNNSENFKSHLANRFGKMNILGKYANEDYGGDLEGSYCDDSGASLYSQKGSEDNQMGVQDEQVEGGRLSSFLVSMANRLNL